MTNSMKAPMILPWIAKKAGISEELALKLWRRAASEAEYLTGENNSSAFWGLAVERFLSIVDEEAGGTTAYKLTPAPQLAWMWRHQSRLSMLSLMAAQNTMRFWQNTWDSMVPAKKAA